MNKGIIFDLDGTLWDSAKQVVISWNQALDKMGDVEKHITEADMQGVMGKRLEEIASILFSSVTMERSIEILRACCEEEQVYLEQHGGRLYPKLEEVLETLLQKGYQLFIVSNCQDGYIESFFTYHKLGHYFKDYEDPGRTGLGKGDNISLIVKRNHLVQAVYVGDTQGDYEATMEAGLPFIHAAYGFGKVEAAKYKLQSIEELPKLVEQIFS